MTFVFYLPTGFSQFPVVDVEIPSHLPAASNSVRLSETPDDVSLRKGPMTKLNTQRGQDSVQPASVIICLGWNLNRLSRPPR